MMTPLRPFALLLMITAIMPGDLRSQAFEPGDNVAGLMIGIGGHYDAYGSYSSVTPAISGFYEKATSANVGPGVLGLGGLIAYNSLHADGHYYSYYNYDYDWTYLILGFRGAYHWNTWHEVPELDTYGGLMLSYNIETFHDNTNYPDGYVEYSSSGSHLGLSIYFGSRYYFSEKFGVVAELGYGIAVLNIGAQVKF